MVGDVDWLFAVLLLLAVGGLLLGAVAGVGGARARLVSAGSRSGTLAPMGPAQKKNIFKFLWTKITIM